MDKVKDKVKVECILPKTRTCGVCGKAYQGKPYRGFLLCPPCQALNATPYEELVALLVHYSQKYGLSNVAKCCNLSQGKLQDRLTAQKGSGFRGLRKKHWILRGLRRINYHELNAFGTIQLEAEGIGVTCKICGRNENVTLKEIDKTILPLCQDCQL